MAKVKETRVALKGEKAKKAPKASQTARKVPAQLSEMRVESDSDESSSDSNSGSNSEGEAEKRKSTKKPNVKKVKETEPASPAVPDDSSDESSESESDSDDSNVAQKKAKSKAKKNATPAVVETNGAIHKTTKDTSEDSDESSEDSDSSIDDAEFVQKKINGAPAAAKPIKSTTAAASSDSDSSDEEEETTTKAVDAGAGAGANQTITAKSVPPQPFSPPAGYKSVPISRQNTSTTSSLLSNTASKQIWHITAPSTVPLSTLKSFSLASLTTHAPILTHNGTSYALTEEPTQTDQKRLALPSSSSGSYSAHDTAISRTLHLHQTVNLLHLSAAQSNPTTGSNAAAAVHKPAVRAPRAQPKGLKMRYKPPGFGDADPGQIGSGSDSDSSDIEMADATTTSAITTPGFKVPKGVEKRKREIETTPRKEKKRRKEKESADVVVETPSTAEKKAAREAEEKLVAGTITETKEEKARKKEEKKKRKKEKSK